jgi:hypothetical protein
MFPRIRPRIRACPRIPRPESAANPPCVSQGPALQLPPAAPDPMTTVVVLEM